jgi:hypothetical protein
MRLEIELRWILFPLIIFEMFLQLDLSPSVVNSIDWTWFGKAHTCLYKVPKNAVASIILRWKKYGTTKTLPRSGRPAKLSNRGRRVLVREVTKYLMITLTDLQSFSYISIQTLCYETRNWAQLHSVSIDPPWDVSTTWLDSTCGKFNWLVMIWKGTQLSVRSHSWQWMSEQKPSHEIQGIARNCQ